MGGLGHGPFACNAYHRIQTFDAVSGRILQSSDVTCQCDPASTHSGIQEFFPWYRATFFVENKPSVWFREGHENNASPAFAVVFAFHPRTHIPRNTTHSSARPFAPLPAHRSASVLFVQGVGDPTGRSVPQAHPSTTPFPQEVLPSPLWQSSVSSWRGRLPNPQSCYCLL